MIQHVPLRSCADRTAWAAVLQVTCRISALTVTTEVCFIHIIGLGDSHHPSNHFVKIKVRNYKCFPGVCIKKNFCKFSGDTLIKIELGVVLYLNRSYWCIQPHSNKHFNIRTMNIGRGVEAEHDLKEDLLNPIFRCPSSPRWPIWMNMVCTILIHVINNIKLTKIFIS